MNSSDRFTLPVAVSLLLIRDNSILLIRRFNTGWQDGMYGVPAGHIDGNESALSALCREAEEEIGILLKPEDVSFANICHTKSNKEYMYLYFVAKQWTGEPYNKEPHKCDKLLWAPLDDLPQNLIPSIRIAIEKYQGGVYFLQEGWA